MRTKPAISLRRSLRTRVAILVSSAVLLAGLAFFVLGLRPMIGRIAEDQFSAAAAQVETSLDRLFEPAEHVLNRSQGWIAGRAPDNERPDGFNRLFRPVLETLPQATSAVAGTSDGDGWMLLKQGDGSWRNRLTRRQAWGEQHRFFVTDADGRRQEYWQTFDYDPRARSWYKAALEDGKGVQWTAPYIFFTTGDPGITASRHIKLADGRDFVVGIDLMLRDLSETTIAARVGQRGMALVLTEDRRVLALPAPPPGTTRVAWQQKVMLASGNLGVAPLTDALARWQPGAGEDVFSYRSSGDRWLARMHAYRLGSQRLWVVTLAPEADFATGWMAVAALLGGGLLALLAVAALFARRQAERIAEPLEELAARSERIGQLDFRDQPLAPSGIAEIDKLATAHERMRTLLYGNQQQLASQENELRDQIAELRAAEAKLVTSERRQQTLLAALPDLIWLKDQNGTYLACNHRFERFVGAAEKEIIGKTDYELFDRELAEFFREKDRLAMARGGPSINEEWVSFADDGHRELLETTKAPMFDAAGQLIGVLGVGHDITERSEHEKQLKHIAHYDILTTLPNRALLADRLQQAMVQADRRQQLVAAAYLDLDAFKVVNDQHGHGAGDRLLIALASRMKQTLRESDTLARLGGDEFVAVLLDLPDVSACLPMLTRLLAAAAEPLHIDGLVLQVSASLGVTFYPQAESVDADQLLRQADQAMYQAKLAGKNRYHVFDAEQDRSVRGHHESIEDIRRALADDEFVLHYQPKVNMRTGRVVGAEALIRWQHPQRGLLPPSAFLPTIEEHTLAVDIGEWVIETALQRLERWREQGFDLPLSVNIGARQLQQDDFVDRLRALLAAHPSVRASDLELEVLETSALEDVGRISAVIEACRGIGVLFSLDDFGTGYSSLTYLKRLSVNQLKIDQSFVRGMLDDPDDLAILGGVLSLANAFHRGVIAEGVETVEHGTMLLQLGCDFAQGYGIARPMPGDDLPAWALAWRPEPAWRRLSPVSREDLPLLLAGVEHRAWLVAVANFLHGEREDLPLIHHQCRFRAWLDDDGQALYGEQPAFATLVGLHDRMHKLGDELCELHWQADNARARDRFSELSSLQNSLRAQIDLLLATNPHRRGNDSRQETAE